MTRENEEAMSVPEQAARWWRVMRDEEPSAAEKREFAEWVAQAPKHIEEVLRTARAHKALSRPDVRWPSISAEALIREAKASREDSVVPLTLAQPRASNTAPARGPLKAVVFGLAATVLLALGVSWFALMRPQQFETKTGEQRSVVLADGSRVTLNTASRIEVRLAEDLRAIDLVEGEALFEVAHDPQRPFDVRVNGVVVRAVGTQFDVDRRATRSVVTVLEGRVSVSGAGGGPELLSAGERIVIEGAVPGSIETGVNLADAVSWTQRQLVFRRRPLGEIVDELNRYNTAQIEIRSPTLRKQEVTGIFRTDDLASFVALLAGKDGVRITANGAGGYIVTSDDSIAAPGK